MKSYWLADIQDKLFYLFVYIFIYFIFIYCLLFTRVGVQLANPDIKK